MILNWFLSKTVREATAMRKHVWKLLQAQRDILSSEALTAMNAALESLKAKLAQGANRGALRLEMEQLEFAANQWLRPYPHAAWRENVEVLLVALTVAMGIRTFFLQPFKIPTGSMQPTLWGVSSENLLSQPGVTIPTSVARVRDWAAGASYVHLVATRDGRLEQIQEPWRVLIFNVWQKVRLAGEWHTLWFPPDYGAYGLAQRAGLELGTEYRKGEEVIKLRVKCGDHLFVNRLTYNFRRPQRGEIVVFETAGIEKLPQDQYYIKRLVGLGGETIQIGDDRHLRINGVQLDRASDFPHFADVYGFDPKAPPRDSHYSGHVNGTVAGRLGMNGQSLAPLFLDPEARQTLPPNRFMVMGDNTLNSYDSRAWGSFKRDSVIGKSSFVYWPISSRFGWGYH
jgi:signal peptidase I